jgi:hypothetical protein
MLEFRAEFFNVVNHPNFKAPGAQVFHGRYGDSTAFSEADFGWRPAHADGREAVSDPVCPETEILGSWQERFRPLYTEWSGHGICE